MRTQKEKALDQVKVELRTQSAVDPKVQRDELWKLYLGMKIPKPDWVKKS